MKNLQTYEEFIAESKLGTSHRSESGYSEIIISKEVVKGESLYRDDKGNVLKSKPEEIEEDVMSDPSRTIGTGTYTATTSDSNFMVGGSRDVTDASSGGSTFFA